VEADNAGLRLDKFLAARSGLSRGACRRILAEGGVWLDGRRTTRLSRAVRAGERVEIFASPHEQDRAPEPSVLFEDDALLALDKPALLHAQQTQASDRSNALAWARSHTGREVFSVHRLDLGTSGVMLVAKTRAAATALAAQLREGRMEKRYLALSCGRLPRVAGTADMPLRRGATPGRYEVAPEGLGWPSRTEYRLVAARGPVLLVEARPKTGRTHQIRVHLSALGAPLMGDRRYRGPSSAERLSGGTFTAPRAMLHAAAIGLTHPISGIPLLIEAPLPADFLEAVRDLGLAPLGSEPT
jgi:23S rRNA pseudouridine1911/1915/1917 synthase